jgi:hypothetical protein
VASVFTFTFGHSSPTRIAKPCAELFRSLKLFADLRCHERKVGPLTRIAQSLHKCERICPAFLFRNDHINVARVMSRKPGVHLCFRSGRVVDEIREHHVAHAEAKRW